MLAYTFQILFDFAGYSAMAIGMARMLGFHFPENFNRPYTAITITDFWRRWHMTLTRWFRDYLYIPLGGNRHGGFKTMRNLVIVFFLCGLWHGAATQFIVWGLYHGALLVIERVTKWDRRTYGPLGRGLQRGITLCRCDRGRAGPHPTPVAEPTMADRSAGRNGHHLARAFRLGNECGWFQPIHLLPVLGVRW
jgi:D-alanyl-lipoteichoic acid acyltransferase DltB (MBOAT superfamily)